MILGNININFTDDNKMDPFGFTTESKANASRSNSTTFNNADPFFDNNNFFKNDELFMNETPNPLKISNKEIDSLTEDLLNS